MCTAIKCAAYWAVVISKFNSISNHARAVKAYSLTSPYGHLYYTDSSFVPRNAKNDIYRSLPL